MALERAGRKPREFSAAEWDGAALMAACGCSQAEICASLKTHHLTLKAACEREHSMPLAEWMEQQVLHGKAQIKLTRWQKAIKHQNWKALEYLSRVLLNEHPTSRLDITEHREVTLLLPQNGREVLPGGRQATLSDDAITIEPLQAITDSSKVPH